MKGGRKYIKVIYPALAVMVITFWFCRKDPPIYEPHDPTPYTIPGIPEYFSPVSFPQNPLTVEGIALGRMLFYDSTLSKNNTVACANCHYQGYGFTDRGKQFSSGVYDSIGNRNSMALFNIPWERGPFFWDGRAPILDSQIVGPVPNLKEMHEPWPDALARLQARPEYPKMYYAAFHQSVITKENTVKAIAQFLRTITSFHSRYDSMRAGLVKFTPEEEKGYILYRSDPQPNAQKERTKWTGLDCFHCHAEPNFVPESAIPNDQLLMDNGVGRMKVKVPSLRNLKFTAPYMFNGSLPNVDSVIAHYDHEVDLSDPNLSDLMYAKKYKGVFNSPNMNLAPDEIAALKAFLNTLNDASLVTNPAYSNPFER